MNLRFQQLSASMGKISTRYLSLKEADSMYLTSICTEYKMHLTVPIFAVRYFFSIIFHLQRVLQEKGQGTSSKKCSTKGNLKPLYPPSTMMMNWRQKRYWKTCISALERRMAF